MKFLVISLILFSYTLSAGKYMMMPPPPPMEEPPPAEIPPNNSGTGPANTVTGVKNTLGGVTNPVSGVQGNKLDPNKSGAFSLENFTLNGGATFTSFDDSSDQVGSSGHFREYRLSLSGNITENDYVSIGFSNTEYETGGANHILARTNGVSVAWVHNLNENYGIGAFGLINDLDIEDINGNSFSYAYGLLFTTFHDFDYFTLSSATALAHTDFDIGYDQIFMTSWTVSKYWTDKFGTYLTLTFTDSLKSDPDTDPTYGTWEIGAIYQFNDHLSFTLGFSKTEFLNNYDDNSLILNVSYNF